MSIQKTEVTRKKQVVSNKKQIEQNYCLKKENLIEKISYLHKYIDPYTMEYIRHDPSSLVDILFRINNDLNELSIIALKDQPEKDMTGLFHYRDNDYKILDIRSISSKIGPEPYGRTFKFLEIMNERFRDYPELLFLNKLKYKSDNSPLKIEMISLKNKIYELEHVQ